MKMSKQDMDDSHERIIRGASRLFRERGIKSTSVADAMADAGMTHGGFYRHFKSKDELVEEALKASFDEFAVSLESRLKTEPAAKVLDEYRTLYLSRAHLDNPGQGCPMPAMGGDLARETEEVKLAYGRGYNRVIDALALGMKGTPEQKRKAAMREIAMLVGAIVIGRASDAQSAEALLEACRS